MITRKRILIFAVCLTVLTVAASLITVSAVRKSGHSSMELKSYGDHVALYIDGRPDTVYRDIDLSLLTDYDRYLLRNGIEISNKEQLKDLLEDYDAFLE